MNEPEPLPQLPHVEEDDLDNSEEATNIDDD